MIRTKNFSHPEWRDISTSSKLPESLFKLYELAHNLWWVWNPKATSLFEELNPKAWSASQGNPVAVLTSLSKRRITEIENDKELLRRTEEIYQEFQAYISQKFRNDVPSVAYFSMEYGLTNVLKIYSGGLGVLAGDYLKEASDSRINMVGVGFLYRYGYFDQSITADGQQIAEYKPQEFNKLPIEQIKNADGTPMILEVPFPDRTIYCNIWKVSVGRVSLYLMDTDLPQNNEWDRSITHQLYGGDWENRMKQEYMLGIGGVMMLNKLGIQQDLYHCNEGHAAFLNVQRLLDCIEQQGMNFDEAIEIVRATGLYTVHTPVPAGHDYFDEQLLGRYMSHFAPRLGLSWEEFVDLGRENPGSQDKFSMSVFALNTCQCANGVSLLHGLVSQKMFAPVWKGFFPEELHVGYVTNGVHLPTWMAPEWKQFVTQHINSNILEHQSDEKVWDKIQTIPNAHIWEIRKLMKERFVRFIKESYQSNWLRKGDPSSIMDLIDQINPNSLLIGFGRRFATYKRAHLLFTDLDRLSQIVNNPKYPVQFIFTGKAHPADGGGQGLIKHIVEISKRPEFHGKIIFLENYDIRVAQYLIAGVDIWLNTPTRPLEASGTSGEKALMNGVLNFSVLDGWWYEGYRENAGWALTEKRTYQNQSFQDKLDAATIYKTLEDEIVPLYFDRTENPDFSEKWVQIIKNSMNLILPHYTMKRMIDDYIEKFYTPLAERAKKLTENNAARIHEIVQWKNNVAQHWNNLEVVELSLSDNLKEQNHTFVVGEEITLKLVVDAHNLNSDLCVQLLEATENEETKELSLVHADSFELKATEGSRKTYTLTRVADTPGIQKIAIRIMPNHELLPHHMDFAYMKWIAVY